MTKASQTEKPRRAGLFGWLRNARQPARVPEGERVYVVGDIHGRLDLLDRLLSLIESDAKTAPPRRTLVFVGDYIDRGSDSRGVIERLLSPPPGFSVRHLRGNHDQAILDFLNDPATYRTWKNFGAPETLLSYGVRPPLYDNPKAIAEAHQAFVAAFPLRHRDFFESLALSHEIGDYFFVHAGIRPGVAF